MMESPPNANAREIPQKQILNLSQPPAGALTNVSRSAPVTNFPSEIDDILNENSDVQFRNRLRDYNQDLNSRHVNSEDENCEDIRRDDSERGFMATSINILSDGNMDMDMNMDMYNNMYTSP